YKLHHFFINPITLSQYLIEQDFESNQDLLLFTWLLSLLESMLPRVVRCVHSWHIWKEIHKYFHSQLNMQFHQLRLELKYIVKGDHTVEDYLARIQAIINFLLSIGDLVSHLDHIDSTLNGLPHKYNLLYVESMFFNHEAKIEKSKKICSR
ncbi:hypothetical protein CR513_00028, partial [Mucuna pruriens]